MKKIFEKHVFVLIMINKIAFQMKTLLINYDLWNISFFKIIFDIMLNLWMIVKTHGQKESDIFYYDKTIILKFTKT